jgi:cytosine/adenosine deaminase-related metal-dependent hydrolase
VSEVIFRGGVTGAIVTVDGGKVVGGDVAIVDGAIAHVGGSYTPRGRHYEILDCEGCVIMPGLAQAHTHLCQTLARGRADDLELLDWLAKVVWPYEGSLDEDAASAAAELACAELLLGGTTSVLDMATVHHTDAVFSAAARSGLRATIGKAMMDAPDPDIPPGLRETTQASLDESARLHKKWHGASGGRLRYAYAPRFVLSCTDELLREVARRGKDDGARIHTHASENQGEIAAVRRRFGVDNIEYLASIGMLGDHVTIAHCVHLSDRERKLLADTRTHVAHCPSSNLKLASGICRLPELLTGGVRVGIGADGAPCNNNLDGFLELRLAALLHKPGRGPRTLPAPVVVELATAGGAAAMGLGDQIGVLDLGRRGDVIAVDMDTLHAVPTTSAYSAIAYAARSSDVRHVAVDGQVVVRDRTLLTLDVDAVRTRARAAARRLFG